MEQPTEVPTEAALTEGSPRGSLFERVKNPEPVDLDGAEEGASTVQLHPRWRRRQTLVNREYQLRFSTVLLVQMTTVILAISAFAFIESRVTMDLVLRHLADFPVPSYQMHQNNQAFLFKIILVIAAAALTQILFGIYASHKFAGPVLKMTRLLEKASTGEYSGRIRFRDGDHLEDLALAFNRFLGNLATEQAQARDQIDAIESAVHRVRMGEASHEEVQALRQRLLALASLEQPEPAACGR